MPSGRASCATPTFRRWAIRRETSPLSSISTISARTAKVAPELVRIAKEDGKLRIAMKDWPIFVAVSQYAAKMALATKYQNKYHEAHAALIGATTKLSEQIVQDLLSKAGVDIDQAVKDMTTYQPAIEVLLARNNEQAEAFGFQDTPAFIVGTFRVPGVLDAAGFE